MKLEDQVVSLNLAKRLKELGVKQESLFYWEQRRDGTWFVPYDFNTKKYISAFTVAELGEMLPDNCHTWRQENGMWAGEVENSKSIWEVGEYTEADARAKMLIYLLENKLL